MHLLVDTLRDLRYSARSLARTPALTSALILTIAAGVGSNAAVQGFVRGFLRSELPLPGIDRLVSVFGLDASGATGPLSYDDFLALRERRDLFDRLGAGRESQASVVVHERATVMSVASLTSDLAGLLDLGFDHGVVVSHRVWWIEFGANPEVRGERIRVDGVDHGIAGIAPEWLEGLYRGRAVDIWMPLPDQARQANDRGSGSFWVLGRLRDGVSIDGALTMVGDMRKGHGAMAILPYTGLTPEAAGSMGRMSALLRIAAAAVFVVACANVASFLLARASTRSRETAVRVAIGARRGQLARQLIADSVLIAAGGAGVGLLLATWTADIIPALFFEEDTKHLVFAPDRAGIGWAAAACAGITIVCGLLPLLETRHDDPAAVLQRENAGPSRAMHRLRYGIVLTQMACCSLLLIGAGLLLQGFRATLQTSAGLRLGNPIVATVEALQRQSIAETSELGLKYFRDVEEAARSVVDVAGTAWVATMPGNRPAWHSVRLEPPDLPSREVDLDVRTFTSESLGQIALPPVAGRMVGVADTGACRGAVVNEEAAALMFDGGDAIGRSIQDFASGRVEIVGVVAMRGSAKSTARRGPAIYYADAGDRAPARAARMRFRVPVLAAESNAVLQANVISPSFIEAARLTRLAGTATPEAFDPRACRVGLINEEAAELHFGGHAVGGAVIDRAGRRTSIIGVVRSTMLRTEQRRVEPTIYLPMAQEFLPRMTVMLGTSATDDATVKALRQRLADVPGGRPDRLTVTTLDAHLSKTALAPERIATMLVGASAATAVALGILGLYAVMTEATRRRTREFALRLALGAQSWRVIRHVLVDGLRLVGAGTTAGMLGAALAARWLRGVAPHDGGTLAIWLTAPLILAAAAAIACALPARRALSVDPLSIMRDP